MPSMRAYATFWFTRTNGSKETTVKLSSSSMSLWKAEY